MVEVNKKEKDLDDSHQWFSLPYRQESRSVNVDLLTDFNDVSTRLGLFYA